MCSVDHLLRQLLLTLWIACMALNSTNAFSGELPCHFYESINISGGVHNPDRSITFNGIEYYDDQYAEVEYDIVNGTTVTVTPYFRGCSCKVKSCLRLCCPFGMFTTFTIVDEKQIKICDKNESAEKFEIKMQDKNNHTINVNSTQLSYVDGLCDEYFVGEKYLIYDTGEVTEYYEPVNHRNYCISIEEDENKVQYQLLVCSDGPEDLHLKFRLLPWVMLISVVFIIFTLIVYIALPELHSLNVYCFLCYLVSLGMAFIFISWIRLLSHKYVEPPLCKTLASIAYFSSLSAVTWTNVISFDVCMSFRKTIRVRNFTKRVQLLLFMSYALGLPLFLLVLGHLIDYTDSVPEHLKPGIGTETCFLKESSKTGKVIFWHLPMFLIFTVNLIFFIFTSLSIYRMKREVDKVILRGETNQTDAKTNKENFSLYVRLFLMMGVIWIMEIFSFTGSDVVEFIADFLNMLQGVIIFVLFVLRRRVLDLIKKRWNSLLKRKAGDTNNSSGSNATNESDLNMQQLNNAEATNTKSEASKF